MDVHVERVAQRIRGVTTAGFFFAGVLAFAFALALAGFLPLAALAPFFLALVAFFFTAIDYSPWLGTDEVGPCRLLIANPH